MANQISKKILVAGYYGFGNTGDETILTAMLAEFRKQRKDLDFTVVSGNPTETILLHKVKSISWTDTQSIYDAIQRSDLVLVGGGGIFHDQFGFKEDFLLTQNHAGIAYFSGFPLLAAMHRKSTMLYAVGVGPLETEPGKKLTKISFGIANIVTVRDFESFEIIKKYDLPDLNIRVTADPAFCLNPDKDKAQQVLLANNLPKTKNTPIIAVCPRYWDINVSPDEWQTLLANALDEFINEVNGEILFIPFQNLEATPDVNDLAVAINIREKMKNKDQSTILIKEYPPEISAGIIASCDFVIGMRYHSLIFSIISATPLVGLVYDPKVLHLLKQTGMEEYSINLESLSLEKLQQTLRNAWAGKDKNISKLSNASVSLRESAKESTTLALQLLDEQIPGNRRNVSVDFLWELAARQTYALAKSESMLHNLRKQLSVLIKLKHWFVPPGSKRDSLLRVLKHEGLEAVFQRGLEKIRRILRRQKTIPIHRTGKTYIQSSKGKTDVLCFPVIDWDFRFQRPQQILSQFANDGHRVFYLNLKFKNPTKDSTVDVFPIADNIYNLTLPGDPSTVIYYNDLTNESLNHSLSALIKFIREENLLNTICVVHHPFWTPLIQQLKEKYGWRVVYDCMDDHSEFAVTHQEFASLEDALISTSDLVIATSELLYNRLSKAHKNCLLIPNGGDFEHFNKLPARDRGPLEKLPRPIIGYYGAIAEWFDTNAIRNAATIHPDWSFVLIGHTSGLNLRDIKKLRNIHFLGEKSYSELPSYLTSFDVCTIPFLQNPLTEATNPVKVFEYLSAAKPVVATSLPELFPMRDTVYLYSSPEEFSSKLEQALQENSNELQEHRLKIARANTWEIRYQALQPKITALFGKASIIIVTWNNLDHTLRCIQSVLADNTWPNFEVIIVDNGSTDGTVEYIKKLSNEHANVRVILNDENLGFAAANNIGLLGIHDHESEYIVLLNNDTVVPTGWLVRLLSHLTDPTIGMVGPVTNSIGNEARIDVPYKNLGEMHSFAQVYMAEHQGKSFDIDVLAMYCVAMRKEVFDKVGPLDASFGIGMFEDDDYARRVQEKEYRIVCATDTFVHHHGRASFAKLESNKYSQLFDQNRKIFEKKWNTKWVPHKRSKS